jgi:alkylation response protein AidB-like acyl-CoA dehydrogenase
MNLPDFYLSPEGNLMLQTVRTFVDRGIIPFCKQIDEENGEAVVQRIFRGISSLGLFQAHFPAKYGGLDLPSPYLAPLLREELSRGDGGISVAWSVTGWAFRPAILANNETVLKTFVPEFCHDEPKLACFAMTEPTGGCDIENLHVLHGKTIRTRAERKGSEWIINGTKRFASNSGVARMYCVVCQTDPNLGEKGIALIYVPYPWPGVSFGKFEEKAGMKADRNCDIYLEDVRVPINYCACGPGEDYKLLKMNLIIGRINSAGTAIGNARGAFEKVIEYTSQRVVQGKPIREHSLCAAMLADMAIGIETARAYMMQTFYMFQHPELYGPQDSDTSLARASIAKVYAAEVAVMVANRSMELMGSYGYMKDYGVEKYWRDGKEIQLWLGGAQLARLDIASALPFDFHLQ